MVYKDSQVICSQVIFWGSMRIQKKNSMTVIYSSLAVKRFHLWNKDDELFRTSQSENIMMKNNGEAKISWASLWFVWSIVYNENENMPQLYHHNNKGNEIKVWVYFLFAFQFEIWKWKTCFFVWDFEKFKKIKKLFVYNKINYFVMDISKILFFVYVPCYALFLF